MKFWVLFLSTILFTGVCFADTASQANTQSQPSITTPQNIKFDDCTKMFSTNKDKLFYLTLGSISANKFTVDEIQTENGYIVFTAANNQYLATIGMIDSSNAILKITPCNNIYFFQPGIIINIFKYIDINLNTDIKV